MKFGGSFCAMGIVVLLAGCASSGQQHPTHRWVSTVNSNSAEYRADNSRCMREISGDSTQREFAVNTPEYALYVQCMNAQGYELTAMK